MPQRLTLNCTQIAENVLNCSSPSESNNLFFLTATWMFLILSAIGLTLNSIASYILVYCVKINRSRFWRLLRIYTFNCVLINLNDTLICILTLSLNEFIYYYRSQPYVSSKTYSIYFTFVSQTTWSLTYTFSSLLDLLLVYERILIYLPSLKFLKKTSATSIFFGILVYTVVINVPIFMSREYGEFQVNFNESTSIGVYFFDFKEYQYQNIFLAIFYTFLSLRDILQLILDICFNTILIVLALKYYKTRKSLNKEQHQSNVLNNTKIAFIICLFSAIVQLSAIIPLLAASLKASHEVYSKSAQLSGLLNGLKHTSNFFFLFTLNSKFRNALMFKKEN